MLHLKPSNIKKKERNKINDIGIWSGVNCMGKILTICKWCLDNNTEPPIDYDLLNSKIFTCLAKS